MQTYLYIYESINILSKKIECVRMHKIFTNDKRSHLYDWKFYIQVRHRGSFRRIKFSNALEFCKYSDKYAMTPEEAIQKYIKEQKKIVVAKKRQIKSAEKQLERIPHLNLSKCTKADQFILEIKKLKVGN